MTKTTAEVLRDRYLNKKQGVESKWNLCVSDLEKDLENRAELISSAYKSTLNDKQLEKVLREEEFVKKIAEFLNDSESVINIFKNAILSLLDVFYSFEQENVFLKQEVSSERLKTAKFKEWLKINNLYEQYCRETSDK